MKQFNSVNLSDDVSMGVMEEIVRDLQESDPKEVSGVSQKPQYQDGRPREIELE